MIELLWASPLILIAIIAWGSYTDEGLGEDDDDWLD
jgi:hypothetical protein